MNDSTDISHQRPPPSWRIALAFTIVYLSWGTTYYATTVAMNQERIPPAIWGGLRLVLGGSILLIYQIASGQSLRLSRSELAWLGLISIFLFLLANLLINVGQQEVPSGVSAILVATTPLWIGLIGVFFPQGEFLSWRGWLGLVLGFAGVLVTMAPQLTYRYEANQDAYALAILGSAACWAAGSLLSRHLALQIPHLTSAGYLMLFGGILQTALSFVFGEWQRLPEELSPRVLFTFFYLLIVGSLAGFVAFNWLLAHVPAAKVGTYAYVNPVIAVFVGWCFGETEVHALLILGILIILVGVYLVRSDHRPAEDFEFEPE